MEIKDFEDNNYLDIEGNDNGDGRMRKSSRFEKS